jgi:hypothetical protein
VLNPISFALSTYSTLSTHVSPLIGFSSKPPKLIRELSVREIERGAHGKNGETFMDNNGKAQCRRRSSPEPRRKSSISGEPTVRLMNRKHRDKALDEMDAAVLSNFANDAWIESNCSPELEPPLTSASNSGNCGSNLGKQF